MRPGSYCSQELKNIEFIVPETGIEARHLLKRVLVNPTFKLNIIAISINSTSIYDGSKGVHLYTALGKFLFVLFLF